MSAVATHPRLAEIIAWRKLRQRIERAVGRLIEALDALDPDPEAEPWLGAPELPASCRAVVFLPGTGWTHTMPLEWARGVNDDREQEDENGGDIPRQATTRNRISPASEHPARRATASTATPIDSP